MDPGVNKAFDDEIDLLKLFGTLWRRKVLILLITAASSAVAIVYALLATPVFRAETVVQIREQSSSAGLAASLAANLGGLASLVGIPASGGGSVRSVALATAKSRTLLEAFIQERNLLPILFFGAWDSAAGRWKTDDPKQQPTLWQAVRLLNSGLLQINEDKKTGLVTVAVEWRDPVLAANWANAVVAKTNEMLRARALAEGAATLAYLQEEAKKTPSVEIQAVAYRLMEGEMQKLMVARGTQDYALEVIDAAVPPERKIRPRRAVIAIGGFMAGFILGCLGVLIASAVPSGSRASS